MTVPTSPASGGNAVDQGGNAAMPAAAPAVPMVSLTIDGVPLSVPKGSLVIRAAEAAGIQIPRFCDHPLLDPAGACRQCLVDVATPGPDGSMRPMPKPQASCTVTVSEGMQVKTQHTSPVADKAQQGVMELLLINHPLDCPVCDKGGECPLQNQAMSNGRAVSRFTDVKRTFPKPVHISTQVLLDRERCVLCQRCTRFSDQIAGDPFIALVERGADQQIGIYQEQPFQSYFSGNTVQICPVGALTGAMYRFRSRPFDLVSTATTCEHCAAGCSLRTDHRRGAVLRRMARDNPAVNEEWNCDKGRWAFQYATLPDRLTDPMVRGDDGELHVVSWPEALRRAGQGLARARAADGVGVLPGGRLTYEDVYTYSKFARVVLGTNDIDFRSRPGSAEEVDFLGAEVAGTGPDTGGVTYADLETCPTILFVGLEAEDEAAMMFLRLRKAARADKVSVFAVAPFATRGLSRMSGSLIQAAPGTEAQVLDAIAARADGVEIPADALAVPGSIIAVGERLATVAGALSSAVALARRTGARLVWVPCRAGDRGGVEAGALPTLLPGARPVTDAAARRDLELLWEVDALPSTPGRDAEAIVEAAATGSLSGLLVGGVEVADLVGQDRVRQALRSAFVVSLEVRRSEVTAFADVVLPVAPIAEKPGSFVNWEGRRCDNEQALHTPALGDHRVLDLIAEEMGAYLGARTVPAVRAELAELPTWAGAAPAFAPRAAAAIPVLQPGQVVLATWRQLLDRGRLQDGEPFLAGTALTAVARLSANTAAAHELSDGDFCTVSSRAGAITLPVCITDMADHVVWLPTNAQGSSVRSRLDAVAADVVTLSAGGAA